MGLGGGPLSIKRGLVRVNNESYLRILTVNRHTAYLYLLSKTGHQFFVAGGERWGSLAQRPMPENIVVLYEKPLNKINIKAFDVVLGHDPLYDMLNLGLLAIRNGIPYIQILHGRCESTGYRRSFLYRWIKKLYRDLILRPISLSRRITFVFISPTVQQSWRLPGKVIRPGIPIEEMTPYQGNDTTLLIVGNDLHRAHFDFSAIQALQKVLPVRIVGHNPKIPEARPAHSWEELKGLYSSCRAYVNVTREPEHGYNLATLEAMASGMPVVTLQHPTSPIRDGFNGLVAKDVGDLIEKGRKLLQDHHLAKELGRNARQTIIETFSIQRFVDDWNAVLKR